MRSVCGGGGERRNVSRGSRTGGAPASFIGKDCRRPGEGRRPRGIISVESYRTRRQAVLEGFGYVCQRGEVWRGGRQYWGRRYRDFVSRAHAEQVTSTSRIVNVHDSSYAANIPISLVFFRSHRYDVIPPEMTFFIEAFTAELYARLIAVE